MDVRAILDGSVWPRDVHEFGGDVTDILGEQLDDADDATRADALVQTAALFADPDPVIRTFAVVAITILRRYVPLDDLTAAVAAHEADLQVVGAPLWQVHHATLWDEARYRLTL